MVKSHNATGTLVAAAASINPVPALPPIAGSGHITLDSLTAGAPTLAHSFFGVAQSLLDGVRVLAAAPRPPVHSHALLCGHLVECALKAYLCGKVGDAAAQGFGHNITGAWAAAVAHGLPVASLIPDWVQRLHDLHARPYVLRYMEGLNGFSSPNVLQMTAEVERLVETVRAAM